jgi:aspartate racemase
MKTIGVLGGVGPQATMEFEAQLHRVAQRLVPQAGNTGYPPLVVAYHRAGAFLANDAGAPDLPLRPHPGLLVAAAWLGGIADFLVITSNLTHLFQAQIEEAAGREVVSMVDAVIAEVRGRGWRRVGAVGFGDPVVYTGPLGELGIEMETIDGELQTRLNAGILRVMEGRADAAARAAALEAVSELRERGAEGVILGCTEVPLLLGEVAAGPDLIDPLPLLAEAAVARALA